jgi:hypothetical protein
VARNAAHHIDPSVDDTAARQRATRSWHVRSRSPAIRRGVIHLHQRKTHVHVSPPKPAANGIDLRAEGAHRHVGARRRHVLPGGPGVGRRVVDFHGRKVLGSEPRVDGPPSASTCPSRDRRPPELRTCPIPWSSRQPRRSSRPRCRHRTPHEEWACWRTNPTCRWRSRTPRHWRPACCLLPPAHHVHLPVHHGGRVKPPRQGSRLLLSIHFGRFSGTGPEERATGAQAENHQRRPAYRSTA